MTMGNLSLWSPKTGDITLSPATLLGITGSPQPSNVAATVGTTLSAANIVAGLINRSGPTAAFADVTDTAANIVLAGAVPGGSFLCKIKNTTPFQQTLSGGTGVTFSSSPIIPANSAAEYLVTISADGTAVVFNHVFTVPLADATPEVATALATVGAGTITGAGIAGAVTTRGGVQVAAFTDTTDTAVNIIGAQPNVHVGFSWEYTYVNNTVFPATLAAGAGVTLSGATIIPANSWATYLVTYSAAGTITMVCMGQGYFPKIGTFVANGATAVVVAEPALTANSVVDFGMKTIGGTPAGAPFLSAITPGTGFSVKAAAGDTSTYTYEIRG
jgi:hypothetical protein